MPRDTNRTTPEPPKTFWFLRHETWIAITVVWVVLILFALVIREKSASDMVPTFAFLAIALANAVGKTYDYYKKKRSLGK